MAKFVFFTFSFLSLGDFGIPKLTNPKFGDRPLLSPVLPPELSQNPKNRRQSCQNEVHERDRAPPHAPQ